MKKTILRLPAPLIALAIWILSSQSTLPQIKGVLGFDKLQHLGAFAVLAFAVHLWFWPALKRPAGEGAAGTGSRRIALLFFLAAAAIASAYGAIDEVHQSFVPGRNCNIWDWIADTLGAFLGAGAAAAVAARCRLAGRAGKKAGSGA